MRRNAAVIQNKGAVDGRGEGEAQSPFHDADRGAADRAGRGAGALVGASAATLANVRYGPAGLQVLDAYGVTRGVSLLIVKVGQGRVQPSDGTPT